MEDGPAHRRDDAEVAAASRPRTVMLTVTAAAAAVPLTLGMVSSLAGPSEQPGAWAGSPAGGSDGSTPGSTRPPASTAAIGPIDPTDHTTPTVPTPASSTAARVGAAGGSTGSPTAPPTASGSPGSRAVVSIEAEDDSVDWSGPAREKELAAASGGVVVGGTDAGLPDLVLSTGVSARFDQVTVPTTGRYTVSFHYAAPKSRRATVTVNGREWSLAFPATGDGVAVVSIPAELAAGANVVEFGNDGAPAPDLDRVVVTR